MLEAAAASPTDEPLLWSVLDDIGPVVLVRWLDGAQPRLTTVSFSFERDRFDGAWLDEVSIETGGKPSDDLWDELVGDVWLWADHRCDQRLDSPLNYCADDLRQLAVKEAA